MVTQVERMRRLQCRDRVLVDQLELLIPLEQNGKLVESDDVALQHHAVHEKQGHRRAFRGSSGEEHILQAGAIARPACLESFASSVGERCGMIVEIACL